MNNSHNISIEDVSPHQKSNKSLDNITNMMPDNIDVRDSMDHVLGVQSGGTQLRSNSNLKIHNSNKAFELLTATTNQTAKVSELFTQLQTYLDNLGSKFNEVKEKHQADFLIAYRNHMNKVRRELQELKQKSEDQEKQMKQNDRLINMDKQLNWFREESIKLYQKVESKNKENYELKFRISEMDKEKDFLENQVKALLKKNRLLEVYLYNTEGEKDQSQQRAGSADVKSQQVIQEDHTFYTSSNQMHYDRIKSKVQSRLNEEGQEGLITCQHFPPIQSIVSKHMPAGSDPTGVTLDLTSYVRIVESQRDKNLKQLQTKLQSVIKQSTKTNMVRSDLENFFLDCVETVRRQIMKRLLPQHRDPQRFLKEIKDYNQFRIEDKMKVLELLLTHEKLLVFLYQKIFPGNFTAYVQTISSQRTGYNTEQAINIVAQQFEDKDKAHQIVKVKSGLEQYQSVDQERQRQDSFNITRKDLPPPIRELRSNSVKVSEKIMVKRGKLIFKPF